MNLFDVYPLYSICPEKARGTYLWDNAGVKYLDLYGGHGVISIGHTHPVYVQRLKAQLERIGFYSNSVTNELQKTLAQKLGSASGYPDYKLFLCNSGAEANENALKLASFHTGKKRVIAFKNAFHGRTSAAAAVTDNPAVNALINQQHQVTFLPLNDTDNLQREFAKKDLCAVIIEGIQGVGGLNEGTSPFFNKVETLCNGYGVPLILDEIQSGYGRSGKFFAHQYHHIKPDLITIAKGMGNGFPIGAVQIAPRFKALHGMLGSTFGGNHLACTAAIAVLDILKEEKLISNANRMNHYFTETFKTVKEVRNIKGKGLMLGLEFDFEIAELRKRLLYDKYIFTGSSANKKLLRILPPLNIKKTDIDAFANALIELLNVIL